jgi:hypothetical protein
VFVAKSATLIEEADEAGFWLELLVKIELVQPAHVLELQAEANELVAIFVASRKRVCARVERQKAVTKKKTL